MTRTTRSQRAQRDLPTPLALGLLAVTLICALACGVDEFPDSNNGSECDALYICQGESCQCTTEGAEGLLCDDAFDCESTCRVCTESSDSGDDSGSNSDPF